MCNCEEIHAFHSWTCVSVCSRLFGGYKLIGVKYLYAQTGKVLQQDSTDLLQEETAELEVPDEDGDEGFYVSILPPTVIIMHYLLVQFTAKLKLKCQH